MTAFNRVSTAPSRPRRLLLTADTSGGVWHWALELSRALAGAGVEVVLAAMGGLPTRTQLDAASAVPGLELRPSGWRLPWMTDPWTDAERAGEWLLGLADDRGCDLVHLSEPVFAALPWPVPTVVTGHSCLLSWHEAVRGEAAPPGRSRYAQAMAEGLAAAGAVAAPTRAMLDALARYYGCRGGTVIPNGRTAAAYAPGDKQPFVLTAGRLWDPAKNLGSIERAAATMRWPVHAAGETTAPGEVSGVQPEHVRLLGSLEPTRLARWMARASIYVLPARYEPFGLSILEAAIAECALVLGDIPSLRELWDGVALFVPPDDTRALRHAIDDLIQDAALRRGLAISARRRALRYTPERMGRAYLALYARVLGAPVARARKSGVPACAP